MAYVMVCLQLMILVNASHKWPVCNKGADEVSRSLQLLCLTHQLQNPECCKSDSSNLLGLSERLITSQESWKTEASSACRTLWEVYQEEGGVSACGRCVNHRATMEIIAKIFFYRFLSHGFPHIIRQQYLFDWPSRIWPWLHFLSTSLITTE